jgi:hypothetical protein
MKRGLIVLAIVCQMTLSAGWGPPINVYTDNSAGTSAVGIDSNGNAVIGYTWDSIMTAGIGATQLIDGVPMNTVSFPFATFTSGHANTLNIAVNASGNATFIWTEFNGQSSTAFIRSASFLNGVWSNPVSLTDPSIENIQTNAPPGITIDSVNDSIGLWVPDIPSMSFETNVSYELYSSGTWGVETSLITPTSDFIPSAFLSGSSGGQALAVWPDTGTAVLQGAYFDGMTWTLNLDISDDLSTSCGAPVAVSMNSSNDALILFANQSLGGLSSIPFSPGTDSPT